MKTGGRFHFPLDTVLKVRTLREEQARLELARAQSQLARSCLALSETEALFARVSARITAETFRDWEAPDYQMVFRYLEHLRLALDGWRDRIAREEAVVEEKKLVLERCHQERRLLERLREKNYTEFRRELDKFLGNQIEAIVLARWSHS